METVDKETPVSLANINNNISKIGDEQSVSALEVTTPPPQSVVVVDDAATTPTPPSSPPPPLPLSSSSPPLSTDNIKSPRLQETEINSTDGVVKESGSISCGPVEEVVVVQPGPDSTTSDSFGGDISSTNGHMEGLNSNEVDQDDNELASSSSSAPQVFSGPISRDSPIELPTSTEPEIISLAASDDNKTSDTPSSPKTSISDIPNCSSPSPSNPEGAEAALKNDDKSSICDIQNSPTTKEPVESVKSPLSPTSPAVNGLPPPPPPPPPPPSQSLPRPKTTKPKVVQAKLDKIVEKLTFVVDARKSSSPTLPPAPPSRDVQERKTDENVGEATSAASSSSAAKTITTPMLAVVGGLDLRVLNVVTAVEKKEEVKSVKWAIMKNKKEGKRKQLTPMMAKQEPRSAQETTVGAIASSQVLKVPQYIPHDKGPVKKPRIQSYRKSQSPAELPKTAKYSSTIKPADLVIPAVNCSLKGSPSQIWRAPSTSAGTDMEMGTVPTYNPQHSKHHRQLPPKSAASFVDTSRYMSTMTAAAATQTPPPPSSSHPTTKTTHPGPAPITVTQPVSYPVPSIAMPGRSRRPKKRTPIRTIVEPPTVFGMLGMSGSTETYRMTNMLRGSGGELSITSSSRFPLPSVVSSEFPWLPPSSLTEVPRSSNQTPPASTSPFSKEVQVSPSSIITDPTVVDRLKRLGTVIEIEDTNGSLTPGGANGAVTSLIVTKPAVVVDDPAVPVEPTPSALKLLEKMTVEPPQSPVVSALDDRPLFLGKDISVFTKKKQSVTSSTAGHPLSIIPITPPTYPSSAPPPTKSSTQPPRQVPNQKPPSPVAEKVKETACQTRPIETQTSPQKFDATPSPPVQTQEVVTPQKPTSPTASSPAPCEMSSPPREMSSPPPQNETLQEPPDTPLKLEITAEDTLNGEFVESYNETQPAPTEPPLSSVVDPPKHEYLSNDGKFVFKLEPLLTLDLPDEQKVYSCDICSAVYHQSHMLRKHYLKLHISRKYIDEKDISMYGLETEDVKNSDDPNVHLIFRCHTCLECLPSKAELKSHLTDHPPVQDLTKHIKAKSFKCENCSQYFKWKKVFNRHKKSCKPLHALKAFKVKELSPPPPPTTEVQTPSTPPSLCLYCDESFPDRTKKRNHILSTHPYTRRRHSCIFCKKTAQPFTSTALLFTHLVDSHSSQYFACLSCKERFADAADLEGHRELKHKGEKQEITLPQVVDEPARATTVTPLQTPVVSESPPLPPPSESVTTAVEQKQVSPSRQQRVLKGSPDKSVGDKVDDGKPAGKQQEKVTAVSKETTERQLKVPKIKKPKVERVERIVVIEKQPRVDPETMFYSQVCNNVRDNLLHHLDGKLPNSPDDEDSSKDEEESVVSTKQTGRNTLNFSDGFSSASATASGGAACGNSTAAGGSRPSKEPETFNRSKTPWEKYNFPKNYDGCGGLTSYIKDMSYLDISTQMIMRRNLQRLQGLPEGSSPASEDVPSVLALERLATQCAESFGRQCAGGGVEEGSELSGEWVRDRSYICSVCRWETPCLWTMEDHKYQEHPQVLCPQHELVGEDRILSGMIYNRLAPITPFHDATPSPPTVAIPPIEQVVCTKCGVGNWPSRPELHVHMLECAGEPIPLWTRTPRKKRWRKRRRPRRGLKRNIPSTPQRPVKLRTKPGDTDTIQKMIANLPAKRTTRRVVGFDEADLKTRSQSTIQNGQAVVATTTHKGSYSTLLSSTSFNQMNPTTLSPLKNQKSSPTSSPSLAATKSHSKLMKDMPKKLLNGDTLGQQPSPPPSPSTTTTTATTAPLKETDLIDTSAECGNLLSSLRMMPVATPREELLEPRQIIDKVMNLKNLSSVEDAPTAIHRCTGCGQVSESKVLLRKHQKGCAYFRECGPNAEHKCKTCQKIFDFLVALIEHSCDEMPTLEIEKDLSPVNSGEIPILSPANASDGGVATKKDDSRESRSSKKEKKVPSSDVISGPNLADGVIKYETVSSVVKVEETRTLRKRSAEDSGMSLGASEAKKRKDSIELRSREGVLQSLIEENKTRVLKWRTRSKSGPSPSSVKPVKSKQPLAAEKKPVRRPAVSGKGETEGSHTPEPLKKQKKKSIWEGGKRKRKRKLAVKVEEGEPQEIKEKEEVDVPEVKEEEIKEPQMEVNEDLTTPDCNEAEKPQSESVEPEAEKVEDSKPEEMVDPPEPVESEEVEIKEEEESQKNENDGQKKQEESADGQEKQEENAAIVIPEEPESLPVEEPETFLIKEETTGTPENVETPLEQAPLMEIPTTEPVIIGPIRIQDDETTSSKDSLEGKKDPPRRRVLFKRNQDAPPPERRSSRSQQSSYPDPYDYNEDEIVPFYEPRYKPITPPKPRIAAGITGVGTGPVGGIRGGGARGGVGGTAGGGGGGSGGSGGASMAQQQNKRREAAAGGGQDATTIVVRAEVHPEPQQRRRGAPGQSSKSSEQSQGETSSPDRKKLKLERPLDKIDVVEIEDNAEEPTESSQPIRFSARLTTIKKGTKDPFENIEQGMNDDTEGLVLRDPDDQNPEGDKEEPEPVNDLVALCEELKRKKRLEERRKELKKKKKVLKIKALKAKLKRELKKNLKKKEVKEVVKIAGCSWEVSELEQSPPRTTAPQPTPTPIPAPTILTEFPPESNVYPISPYPVPIEIKKEEEPSPFVSSGATFNGNSGFDSVSQPEQSSLEILQPPAPTPMSYHTSSLGSIIDSVNKILNEPENAESLLCSSNYSLADLQRAMGATDAEMAVLQQLGEAGAGYQSGSDVVESKPPTIVGDDWGDSSSVIIDLDNQPCPPPQPVVVVPSDAQPSSSSSTSSLPLGTGGSSQYNMAPYSPTSTSSSSSVTGMPATGPGSMRWREERIEKLPPGIMPCKSLRYSPRNSSMSLLAAHADKEVVCPSCSCHFMGFPALQIHLNKVHANQQDQPQVTGTTKRVALEANKNSTRLICFECQQILPSHLMYNHLEAEHSLDTSLVAKCSTVSGDPHDGPVGGERLKSKMSTALGDLLDKAVSNLLSANTGKGKTQSVSSGGGGGGGGIGGGYGDGTTAGGVGGGTGVIKPGVVSGGAVELLTRLCAVRKREGATKNRLYSAKELFSKLKLDIKPDEEDWNRPPTSKPYLCSICGQRFPLPSSRNKHQVLAHRNFRPYEDLTTTADYYDNDDDWREAPSPTGSTADGGSESGITPICSDCGLAFETVTDLVKHRVEDHPSRRLSTASLSTAFDNLLTTAPTTTTTTAAATTTAVAASPVPSTSSPIASTNNVVVGRNRGGVVATRSSQRSISVDTNSSSGSGWTSGGIDSSTSQPDGGSNSKPLGRSRGARGRRTEKVDSDAESTHKKKT